ncbi:MAG: hypothetical protein J6Z79_00950, partial [Clostridia bacterium]|nr:hypothetical protein [Clostridia bacterium]
GDAYDAANNNQNKKTIYIDEGEYDFFAEYMAEVYDAENSPHGRILQPVEPATAEEKTTKNIASSQYLEAAVASQNCLPVDRNSTNADGQKFWLNAFVPNNTKIIGLGDVVVRFEPAADEITYNASKTWSPFNIFGNVMIENIDVYGHNCRYCLHNDDHNRYLNTYQYYKDFNLTYTVSDLSTCGVNVGSGIYYGFNHTVGFGVNDGSTHVFDECTITNNTTLTNCAYYGHNASGTNPREAEILLTKCNISTSNANARTIRLQTLSRDNAGHVITTIDRCTVVGGLQLHLYYPDSDHPTWITKQSFEVTFVETHNVPVTRNNASSTDSEVSDRDPYTVKYVNCDPA